MKDYEQLTFIDDFFFWKMADFYTRWLMGDTTPRPVDIEGMNND